MKFGDDSQIENSYYTVVLINDCWNKKLMPLLKQENYSYK